MAITAKVRSNIRLPKINFQQDLLHIANKIMIPLMAKGIDDRQGVDGKPLPKLEPETIKAKGHDRPLIENGNLRRAFKAKSSGKFSAEITLMGDRKKIGGYLQIDGINSRKGKKYFNFFGISTVMERLAINYMDQRIKKAIKDA